MMLVRLFLITQLFYFSVSLNFAQPTIRHLDITTGDNNNILTAGIILMILENSTPENPVVLIRGKEKSISQQVEEHVKLFKSLKNRVEFYEAMPKFGKYYIPYVYMLTSQESKERLIKTFYERTYYIKNQGIKYLYQVEIVFDYKDNFTISVKKDAEIRNRDNYILSIGRFSLPPTPDYSLIEWSNGNTKADLLFESSQEIPEDLLINSKLKILNLTFSSEKSIPSYIWKAKTLERLTIKSKPGLITKIPSQIGNLTNLKYLRIGSTITDSLPKEIGKLYQLEELHIVCNRLKNIPSEIGNLKKLKVLVINYHKSTNPNYPYMLGADSYYKTIPKEIGNLKNLEILSIAYHESKDLPVEIFSLPKLKELSILSHKLERISEKIGNLKKLKKLDLHLSMLSDLPKELGKLDSLNYLDIALPTSSLPSEIGDITTLDTIKIRNKSIRALPLSFSQLSNLKYIELICDSLYILPDFGAMTHLEKLDITSCVLDSLPESLSSLKELRKIRLYNYPQKNLIKINKPLHSVENLIIGGSFESIVGIENFPEVKKLKISTHGLEDFSDHLKALNKVEEIDFSMCNMKKFPEILLSMESLQVIDCWTNDFEFIPPQILQLPKLQKINATYNPLKNINQLKSLNTKGIEIIF